MPLPAPAVPFMIRGAARSTLLPAQPHLASWVGAAGGPPPPTLAAPLQAGGTAARNQPGQRRKRRRGRRACEADGCSGRLTLKGEGPRRHKDQLLFQEKEAVQLAVAAV